MTRLLSRRWRIFGPLLALAITANVVACLSAQVVPEDAPASVKYYAVLTDYNTAKLVALRFVQTPSTPASEARKVLEVVEKADAKIAEVAIAVAAGGGDLNDTYSVAAAALRVAANELRKIAVSEGGAALPGPTRAAAEPLARASAEGGSS